MKAKLLLLLGTLFLAVLPASALAGGPPYPTVFTTQVSAPQVYTNENFTIYANSTYGFNNYSTVLIFSGLNLSGMSNTYFDQQNRSSPNAAFYITAPSMPQTLKILLLSAGIGNGTRISYSKTFSLTVVSPVVMNATIQNPTGAALNNVTVTFSLNNNNVTTMTISQIAPYSSKTISAKTPFTYLLHNGVNTETIYVNNTALTVNGQKATYSYSFYYGPHPNYTWIYYIAAVVVVFMVFLVFSAGRRMPARRPKWKKK